MNHRRLLSKNLASDSKLSNEVTPTKQGEKKIDMSAIHSIASLISKIDDESEEQSHNKPVIREKITGEKEINLPYKNSDPFLMIKVKSKPKTHVQTLQSQKSVISNYDNMKSS